MVTKIRVVVLWVDIAWKGACENFLVVIFLLLEILIYLLYYTGLYIMTWVVITRETVNLSLSFVNFTLCKLTINKVLIEK